MFDIEIIKFEEFMSMIGGGNDLVLFCETSVQRREDENKRVGGGCAVMVQYDEVNS